MPHELTVIPVCEDLVLVCISLNNIVLLMFHSFFLIFGGAIFEVPVTTINRVDCTYYLELYIFNINNPEHLKKLFFI